MGSENGDRPRRALTDRCGLVVLSLSGTHFRERAAAIPKRLCATASWKCGHPAPRRADCRSGREHERSLRLLLLRRETVDLGVFQQNVGASYAAAVQALLEDGPLQGTTVEVEAVEGRPPKTVDVPDDKGGVCRYCLAEWTQEGMTAAYTFLYAV